MRPDDEGSDDSPATASTPASGTLDWRLVVRRAKRAARRFFLNWQIFRAIVADATAATIIDAALGPSEYEVFLASDNRLHDRLCGGPGGEAAGQ